MYRKILIILILLANLPWAVDAQEPLGENVPPRKKFVQILSSYSYEDEWDTSIAKSIVSKISDIKPEISLTVSYAGIGRHNSFLAERFAMQGAFASGKLSAKIATPDVLVLIGDESWMLYRVMDLRGYWEKVPVVLCGMSFEVMADYSRFFPYKTLPDSLMIPLQESLRSLPVTGVVMRNNCIKTLELMTQLLPRLREVVYLTDQSYQDVHEGKLIRQSMGQYPELSLRTLTVGSNNADSVQQVIDGLPSSAALLVNMAQLPERSPVPVFSLRESTARQLPFVGGYVPTVEKISSCTAQLIMRVYNGEPASSLPFVNVDEVPVLNKASVMHFGLESHADAVQGVVYYNNPPSFFVRNIRIIAFWLLVAIVVFFSVLIYLRSRANSRRLKNSLKTFRQLYDKYQMIYTSMPPGLFSLDKDGSVLQRNEGANLLLEQCPAHVRENFNLFRSSILNEDEQQKVRQGIPLSVQRWVGKACFRLIIRPILNEETGENNILMVMTDYTEIEQARSEKETIYDMLNFAMNASALGVAEYNLMDKKGFATQAWYANLGLEPRADDFTDERDTLLPEYRQKVADCLERIRNGQQQLFQETVAVHYPSGEDHWIYYFIQLMEYAPESGRVMVAELTYHMDEQVACEKELTAALHKAREADRLKNAFIANMREEIRIPLWEIIDSSTQLTQEKNPEKMRNLNECIEMNNQVLLNLINQLIEISKGKDE